MKILMVTEIYLPIWGGAENQLRQLIPYLVERECSVSIVTRRWHEDWAKKDQVDGVNVVRLGVPGRSKIATLIFVMSLLKYLLIEGRKVDILHSHGAVNMGALCSIMARIIGKKNIVKIASAGKISPFTTTISGQLVLWMFKKADIVIAMTDEIKEELASINCKRDKIIQITNGVDAERFKPASPEEKVQWRKMSGLRPESRIVLFSSRLVFGKGIDLLLEAWRTIADEFPDTYLLIVGSGEDQQDSIEQEMKSAVEKEGIPHVIFLGATTTPEKLLRIADIFVFPSRKEGFPNALMEALATGLPVVASNIGGVKPLLKDNYTGILFDNENIAQLSEKLRETLGEMDRAQKLGEKARLEMIERFSFHKIAQSYRNLYSSLKVSSRVQL